MTVVFVMLVLYFLGGEPTRRFALALTVGIVAGTYSSIFLASPLLVVWEKWQRKSKERCPHVYQQIYAHNIYKAY